MAGQLFMLYSVHLLWLSLRDVNEECGYCVMYEFIYIGNTYRLLGVNRSLLDQLQKKLNSLENCVLFANLAGKRRYHAR